MILRIVIPKLAQQSDTGFLSKVVQQWEAEADRFESLNISVSKLRFGIVFSTQGWCAA